MHLKGVRAAAASLSPVQAVQQFELRADAARRDRSLRRSSSAIVLSVDEKGQVQALDRTQRGLPLNKGRRGSMTCDYKRHGLTPQGNRLRLTRRQ
jgi:hypothetical protein